MAYSWTCSPLVALLLVVSIPTVIGKRCIVIFGDSLSDTGRLFDWTTRGIISNERSIPVPRTENYWQGRFTNSPGAWPDHIARLSNGEVSVFNYAFGGATACNFPDTFFQGKIPSLSEQVDQYLQQKQTDAAFGQTISECTERTAVIWIGHNDLTAADRANFSTIDKVQAGVFDMGECIKNATNTLLGAGETAVTIGNLMPIDLTPATNTVPFLVVAVGSLNTKLGLDVGVLKLSNPSASVHLWNANDELETFIGDYRDYGFINDTGPCLFFANSSDGILAAGLPTTTCPNPDEYVFYDYVHPGSRSHLAIAQSLSDSLVKDGVFSQPLFAGPAISPSTASPTTQTPPSPSPSASSSPAPVGTSPAPVGSSPPAVQASPLPQPPGLSPSPILRTGAASCASVGVATQMATALISVLLTMRLFW